MTLCATLAEFKAHLNYSGSADDSELTVFLTAGSDLLERLMGGPLDVQTFTEYPNICGEFYAPRKRPLVAVTSMTPYRGSALATTAYVVDTTASVIRIINGPTGLYTVVYTAGLATISDRVKLAGLIIGQHLWRTQRGGSRPSASDEVLLPGMGFAIPRRALDLLGHDTVAGIA